MLVLHPPRGVVSKGLASNLLPGTMAMPARVLSLLSPSLRGDVQDRQACVASVHVASGSPAATSSNCACGQWGPACISWCLRQFAGLVHCRGDLVQGLQGALFPGHAIRGRGHEGLRRGPEEVLDGGCMDRRRDRGMGVGSSLGSGERGPLGGGPDRLHVEGRQAGAPSRGRPYFVRRDPRN